MRSQTVLKDDRGVTLVEILVTIVILGVLAAVVVLAVSSITDKGDGSAKSADVRALEVAEEAYLANGGTGVYAAEADLVTEKFLRSASTKHSVCLNAVGNTSYEVIAQGGACPAGFDFNGSAAGSGTES